MKNALLLILLLGGVALDAKSFTLQTQTVVDSTFTVTCVLCGTKQECENRRIVSLWKFDSIPPLEDTKYVAGLEDWISIGKTHMHISCLEMFLLRKIGEDKITHQEVK